MGIYSLPLTILLLASSSQAAVLPAEQTSNGIAPERALVLEPMPQAAYEKVLLEGEISELKAACADASRFGLDLRLRELRDRLMVVAPAPQPFERILQNTQALMACKAPHSAQIVLSRFGPAPGPQRRTWLLLSWQAANEALDHAGATLALRRLVDGNLAMLDNELLTVGYSEDGLPLTRNALDLFVEHEIALGHPDEAAMVLMAGGNQQEQNVGLGSRRLALLADLLAKLDDDQTTTLLEAALDRAAVDEAWGLAEDLLRLQISLDLAAGGDGEQARQRLERLAESIDDRYTVLELIQDDQNQQEAAIRLQQQLRSPRQPGGHAASQTPPVELTPASIFVESP
ncbi:MAG: Uncharacterised protein [Prochlorococcus marinus str. MIT 9215]|nr:MAG: Uncharacterised protein [Prochlorococcus marinus str. MIT 9215]